ncbi:KpsF/GutQ family sugar-phosphate isomerase [Elioraea tepida]|uniref:KpsF/GutQ family sugar-phosphate isomerase n=1 Tax=Elioraea tepida TaxID=2843330 RepID=A0A975YJF3_9PROT|nr:KpsF/GutQ family sugar-phosphate isomerase [Elioraea tepida]QXM24382.1 KpsF/GutQ family sugar-phosphate isomerase [Elioraea tepida]
MTPPPAAGAAGEAGDIKTETAAGAPAGAADLAAARAVLATEAAALAALAERLDGRFVTALDLIGSASGRVVVTGMGKSGHVARKIAATFASTGTPALFVHPAEASHGDLGMITASDAVLALSNSGETPELADLVDYTRRFAIPLVAITGRAESTLAREADVALLLAEAPEACPMGLAPTTSTTQMLALGDALAVALLARKGFTAADFRLFHPGGRLGRKLLRVRDLMHTGAEVPLAPAGTPMDRAIIAMTAGRFGCLGLVDGAGLLVGIITDGDLRRAMSPDLLSRTAAEVMTASPRTIGAEALAAEALREMNQRRITALFVTEAGRPVGIIHVHDLLRAGVA